MRIPGWLFILGVLAFVGLTAGGAVVAFLVGREIAIDTRQAGIDIGGGFDTFLRRQPSPTPRPTIPPTLTPIPAGPTFTPRPGETLTPPTEAPQITPTFDLAADYQITDPRRINILLMGIDQRSGVEDDGPFRTDTMMLVSVDPVRRTAGVISIPRDLWVNIPGFRQARINSANQIGDAQAYPGGGPALAMETVRQNLGVSVDRYLLINFDVFTTVVETVAPNGIEICVQEEIDDPDYPDAGFGTIHVHFDPGCQLLNAEQLLQYARTRATFGGDFDRARRQQEVMSAVQEQVLSAGGVLNFIGDAPRLWDELTGSFKTNMTLDEILQLAVLGQDIGRDGVTFSVIDNLYVNLATTNTGDQVLVPKQNSISFLIQQTFNPPDTELTLADLKVRADAEGATIAIFNNTQIQGLASQTRDWLLGRGVQTAQIGNTPPEFAASGTIIRDYTDNPWTARYLARLMNLGPDRIQPGADGLTTEDIAIIVGEDVQPLLAGQDGVADETSATPSS